MQEAFIVLKRAKRDATDRLRQAEREGDKSKHKLSTIKHAITELDEAIHWLTWADGECTRWKLLAYEIDKGSRHVQVSSNKQGRRSTKPSASGQ